MTILRKATRTLLLGVVGIGLVALKLDGAHGTQWVDRSGIVGAEATRMIGGPFVMQDLNGRTVTEADFAGRPMLLFFGFTQCPDICPTMLNQMHVWLNELGPLADRVQPVFVTVDPARDTPQVMSDYLSAFDDRIVGLRGTDEQLAVFARQYSAFYEKVPGEGGDYSMNHTANILLFNSDGSFAGTADFHDRPEDALSKIRRLAERADVR